MKRMVTYWKILLKSFSLSHQRAVEYRADYLLRLIRAGLEVGTMLVVILVFYSQIESINGWSRYEGIMVYGFFQFISSLVFTFVGYGINDLPQNIISGKLDQYIVKPVDSQFFISVRMAFVTNVYRSLLGLGIIIYTASQIDLSPQPLEYLLTIAAVLSGAMIYYALTFTASTLAFWTFADEIPEIMYTVTSISRFPAAFFQRIKAIFYILPLAFMATVPASALLGKDWMAAAVSPLVALLAVFLSRQLWLKGLRSYQSASS